MNDPLVLVTRRSPDSYRGMEGLDRVGGVHHAADQRAIVVHQGEVVPIAAPGGDDFGVLLAPLLVQAIEGMLGLLAGGGCIDGLQIRHEFFRVRIGQVLLRVADLMYHAELHVGLRIDGRDGVHEAGQIVYRSDQDVF